MEAWALYCCDSSALIESNWSVSVPGFFCSVSGSFHKDPPPCMTIWRIFEASSLHGDLPGDPGSSPNGTMIIPIEPGPKLSDDELNF
eukprot:scaffold34604_cov164-Amphora_coffeaeformis.AAC.18